MLEYIELIKQYAEDAKHISEPWILYEWREEGQPLYDWNRCTGPILWEEWKEYRRIRCTFQPHVHHKLMLQYAEDVQKYNNPNSMWEFYMDGWHSLDRMLAPSWHSNVRYRRVLVINGIHVPTPETESPKEGTKFYVPSLIGDICGHNAITAYWESGAHTHLLKKGIVHLTREAALTHAEALFSLTQRTV